MMAKWKNRVLFTFVFITSFYSSNGCWMEGVDIWALQVGAEVVDTHTGNVVDRATRDIEGINSYSFIQLNRGPYLNVRLSDSRFIIETNDQFPNYEEYETENHMSVTVNFRCAGGASAFLVFVIEVIDTNNNSPQFLPSDEFVYTIHTPLAPGLTITGCFDGITVRDIDLTTERIDFAIEENPYFEIEYDAAASTTAKEFVGIIRTTTFIRTLAEPITLRITATDVDRTPGPPRTETATVTIIGDTEFEFPEEPVFSQAFYIANYINTNTHQIELPEIISLRSGFDELVRFSLEGDLRSHFDLVENGNQITLRVVTPLPANVLRESQILLVVRAEKEFTSGDTATIVVLLPQEETLEFDRPYHTGTIEDNILKSPTLVITGYGGEVLDFDIKGDYSSYFTVHQNADYIHLTMTTLPEIILNENNVILLEVIASTETRSANTIVALEIVKDDSVTPVFNKPMYSGSYSIETGLNIEQIVIDQGFDSSVQVFLDGDHSDLFNIRNEDNIPSTFTLTTTGIPSELYSQERILLTLHATKPRTVGANAAIYITLPAARQLDFEESTYRGTLLNNILSLEPIVLSTGYDETVQFRILGELRSHFTIMNVQNRVTIILESPIPDNEIPENNVIMLTIEASGLNAISTTTTVLVEVIKEDTTTPVFSRNIYYGTYLATSTVNIENINLAQGFGSDVTFDLEGEHADYFQISNTENNVVVLTLRSTIPEDVIFREKSLLFNIVARKPFTVGANAAISIRFPTDLTEPAIMRFTQNTYEAEVENNILTADDIIISTGYEPSTQFILSGDYYTYFSLTNINTGVSLSLVNSLPVDEIESNFIVLEVEARRVRAISVWTSIVVDIVRQEVQHPVFTRPYYEGIYNEVTDQLLVEAISLAFGYDETVVFNLDGALAPLFAITETTSNTLTITPVAPLPSAVIAENNHLLFSIVASKPNAITARAAISITIEREQLDNSILGFDEVTYQGSIQNAVVNLQPITLITGYSEAVTFTLLGDLADYFTLTAEANGVVRITLPSAIPDQSIPANRLIVLQIRAAAQQALTAHATIVFEVIVDQPPPSLPQLVFDATYYTGSYTNADGLTLNSPITLAEGYDLTVEFDLEGEHAQWFTVVQTGNSVTLRVTSTIPGAVLASNSQLVFVITAERAGSETARATIVITLNDEHTEGSILGFDQITYEGSVQNTVVTLQPITLITGYSEAVTFTLLGDLADYFTLIAEANGVVRITLPSAIPDQSIPTNRLIVLQIRAAAQQALTAHATIVFEVIVDQPPPSLPQLVFDATYYTGSYTNADGLTLNSPITLAEGYDQTVEFDLEGEHAQWFTVVQTGNSVTLRVTSTIPGAVLASNSQLVFVITAERWGSETARATIVITLNDEHTEGSILGFDQITYEGSVQNTVVTLQPITLITGYSEAVTFTLLGDLADYFTLIAEANGVVRITLPSAIPDQSIPTNRLIVLQIRAAAQQALTAHATIVFEVIVDQLPPSLPQLVFDATYYTGSYTNADGLTLNSPITLAEGYDQTVEFDLEGEHAQWFTVVQTGNSVTLRVTSTIPGAVLASNSQLVFVITAERWGSETARATIVITLNDEHTEGSILGFDQITYEGSVQNTVVTLQPITLITGYSEAVTFTLLGDLADYFTLIAEANGVVRITLPSAIPDQSIPTNRLIVLQIRAAAQQALTAHATIVFEVIVDQLPPSLPQLVFDATYYTGSYTNADGLTLNSPITLAEGYDQTVEFDLEGEHAQWFTVVQTGNSVTLRVTSTIPGAVLASNSQLVFVITAERWGSETARATIVITLNDEHTEGSILGFDQITYEGSVQNTVVTLQPITLITGYSEAVTFTLLGDLADYFTLIAEANGVVRITLPSAIPDQSIPTNRLIVLQIRAAAQQALTAHATIVFEVIVDQPPPSLPQLVFDATYYTGSYTNADGLTLNSPITLAEGYDQTVEFDLEGEHAQWFTVVQTGNSVTLRVTSTIPGAVLASNSQLVFVITAERWGSETARATIVITLNDEHTEGSILGFDQITYEGSVQNTVVTLQPITLITGYSEAVTFTLLGDLADYFTLIAEANGVVRITLPSAIPDQSIPTNRLIVLQIRAAAQQALTAHATIVFEVIVDQLPPSLPQLVFDATYYTGSYTNADGLTLNSPITLAEGYDQTVEFDLEGEHAQWFTVVQTGNSVTLRVTSTIPGAVLASNSQLVFVITAERWGSETARATIVITLNDEHTEGSILGFDQITYEGSVQNTVVTLQPITLITGYSEAVTFTLLGDLADYFTLIAEANGVVRITLPSAIPDQSIPTNRLIVLQIRAAAQQALTAHATIVFEVIVDQLPPSLPQLVFDATYYTGSYTNADGLTLNSPITLAEGYDQTVEFDLEGEHAQWFTVVQTGNSVTLRVTSTIPGAVLASNSQLVFVITAERWGSETARATIVITLNDEHTEGSILGFDQITYEGSVQNTVVTLQPITLITGYSEAVTFTLLGDLADYFTLIAEANGVVRITLPSAIPDQSIPTNRLIVLQIRAAAQQALTAHATIVFEVIVDQPPPSLPQLVFDATYYTGSYTNADGLTLNSPITLAEGYDQTVEFDLEGEHAQWFTVVQTGNSVTLRVTSTIPGAVLASNSQLVFVITAERWGSETARATIVITLNDEHTEGSILGFDQITYEGSVQNTVVTLQPITLITGYSEAVTFTLLGDLADYFTLIAEANGVVRITLPSAIPDQSIPTNRLIVLQIRAAAQQALTAHATIVFEVIVDQLPPSLPQLVFDATYYTGSYTNADGLTLNSPITLAEGYDQTVEFDLEGEHAQWFTVVQTGNSVTLRVTSTIPGAVLASNSQLVFVITAERAGSETARATIVITLTDSSQNGNDVSFDKLVYEGFIQLSAVQHESIIISNYNGVDVELRGGYSSLFEVHVVDGVVTVQASGSLTLPDDVTRLTLELHAGVTQAVLLLTVVQSDVPVLPSVTFSSPSYVLNVNVVQTGLVGRVLATADNGEEVIYSLAIDNAHLQARVSINNDGELHLSAPANSGVYTFQVIATTAITQAEGTATVYLTVEAVTVCGDDDGIVVPPLIIIDRDEEEPYTNLVSLNTEQFEGCRFTLTNRWPLNQNWLYVDENGLHARSIDREHESIAFMALSQVQVELILHCETDNAVRTKRSLRTDWLGPYDYGLNKWILTESIPYNARRSLVNLIVNDINDNDPIFVGKNMEPIVVGYPIGEIEERILPRSLAELQATDADVGENAALTYWSSEDVLAVAPTTGFVHVRSGAQLQHNQRLIVSATDRHGEGRTGDVQLMVKLLDLNNIAVVTVKDAFLDNEKSVLAQLTSAVGYEIKALRSVVISDDLDQNENNASRKKRETNTAGASLLLYVYGILQSEPVIVDRLTVDIINNAAVASIISTVSLEDHLPVEMIYAECGIGFMVATIVLSILLFIIILVTAIWFCLIWRNTKNYDQFTDANSVASRSVEELPKPENPTQRSPRFNIEDLLKSERRLQDRLNPQIEEITVEPMASRRENPIESIIDLTLPIEPISPIVIQSIDKLKPSEESDEDEFGEKNQPRRKSVVTFNENVEKIIHVEDDVDTISSTSGYEIFKL